MVNKKICLTVALAVVVVVEAAAVVVVDSSAVDFAVGFAFDLVVAFDFVSPSGPDPFDLVAFDYGDQLHFDLHLK